MGGDVRSRQILLLADRAPSEHAEGGYGEVRSKVIPIDFLDHARYRFKVTVNPTRRNNASGKLMPVKGREAIAEWFATRGPASWGFEVASEHLRIDSINVLQFKDKAQHPVTLAQAHVQGQLRVTDPEQFRKSFAHGIGRGRSFGCGLLQIVPLIDNPFA
jgi:CRISPR system Cascade subunit CasE